MSKHDTMTTVQIAEQTMSRTRFHQEKKVERFQRMLADTMDFDMLYQSLGLPTKQG